MAIPTKKVKLCRSTVGENGFLVCGMIGSSHKHPFNNKAQIEEVKPDELKVGALW